MALGDDEDDGPDLPIVFLRARLAEDEARGLDGRELRELAAKRATVAAFDKLSSRNPTASQDEYHPLNDTWWSLRWVLLNFAAVYDTHPDYQGNWRPKP